MKWSDICIEAKVTTVFLLLMCSIMFCAISCSCNDTDVWKKIQRIHEVLAVIHDKDIYEARQDLPKLVRELYNKEKTSGSLRRYEVVATIKEALPYLDAQDRLYYKLAFYRGDL
jgi:hypothetical protein